MGRGSQKGGLAMGFTSKTRGPRRDPRRGSEKGVSKRCVEHPLGECDLLGVRPNPCLLQKAFLSFCCDLMMLQRKVARTSGGISVVSLLQEAQSTKSPPNICKTRVSGSFLELFAMVRGGQTCNN